VTRTSPRAAGPGRSATRSGGPTTRRERSPALLDNTQVALRLAEIADLLDIQGANAFRVRAYRQAARTMGNWRGDPRQLVQGQAALPGIGTDLAGKIAEIAATGTCALLDELHHELPAHLAELLRVPGLGPKRVGVLHHALGVDTVAQLHDAARAGQLRGLRGFGPRMEQRLLEASGPQEERPGRHPRAQAQAVAQALLVQLRALPGVLRAEVAGSLRRHRETVGDIDLLVAVRPHGSALQQFVAGPRVRQVLANGRTRASVVLDNGMQVDLRAVPLESFGAAWLYFTGSKAHNITLRRLARRRGMKLNEYGLFAGARCIASATEAEIYQALGLPLIDPVLRESRGELAASGRLPARRASSAPRAPAAHPAARP
jgi:DNA polymerase (family X)